MLWKKKMEAEQTREETCNKQAAEQEDKFYLICIFVTIVQNLFQFIPSNPSAQ